MSIRHQVAVPPRLVTRVRVRVVLVAPHPAVRPEVAVPSVTAVLHAPSRASNCFELAR